MNTALPAQSTPQPPGDLRASLSVLRSLEGLRILASVGVVSMHTLPHVSIKPPQGLDMLVDMFFVISGIVIGQVYRTSITGVSSYGNFMRKRLARIYPLHFATLMFYVAVGALVAHYNLVVDDPARFDSSLIPGNIFLTYAWTPEGRFSFNFVSWSISAELFVYLCFPLIALAVSSRRVPGLLVVAVIFVACDVIAQIYTGLPFFGLRWNFGVMRAIPSFVFGVWLALSSSKFVGTETGKWAKVVFSISAPVLAVAILAQLYGYVLLALVYIVVTSGYICDLNGRQTLASWSPISRWGYLTYSLYMLHVPVMTVFVSFLFPKILGDGFLAEYVGMAMALIILAILAELSYRYFEAPMRKLLG